MYDGKQKRGRVVLMNNSADNNDAAAMKALNIVIEALRRLDETSRNRVLQSVATFYQTSLRSAVSDVRAQPPGLRDLNFSTDEAPTPKSFLMEKQPRTDVERIATLAYYLTHYRDMPEFRTLDLAKLNTEAAQPKFSNAAYASQNALQYGYLAPAQKGNRQLSASGERFVSALPDREAAKAAMAAGRPRRKRNRVKRKT